MSPEEVIKILSSDNSSALIGCPESFEIDFKSEPYTLKTERQKHELSKDVVSMANSSGGIIVIGFKTEKDFAYATDVVKEPCPFPSILLNKEKMHGILNDWIYPPVDGLTINEYRYGTTGDKIFLVISVPCQNISVRPFIIIRSAIEENKTDSCIFGMAQRRLANSRPVTAHEIQSLLHDGLLFRSAIDQRNSLSFRIEHSKERAIDGAEADKRIEGLICAVGLDSEPCYALTARPKEQIAVALFEKRNSRITELLEHPPEIRSMGFDLNTDSFPEIVRGESRRGIFPGYKGLEYWKDGFLVFVGPGNSNFLSWGDKGDTYRIHPVALIETNLLFCRLAWVLWKESGARVEQPELGIRLLRMCINEKRPILPSGRIDNHGHAAGYKEASDCQVSLSKTVQGLEADEAAYEMVSMLYEWFGMERDQIPYVDRVGRMPIIDEKSIKSIR